MFTDLTDLQVNGFAGVDFQQDDLPLAEVQRAVHTLHAHGTARILCTLITDRVDALCRRLEHLEKLRSQCPEVAATIVGYHLEGPWLSSEPGYHGAHEPDKMVPPTSQDADRLIAASGGLVRLVTLAPEVPGADVVTAHLCSRGVRVSAGHTNADEASIDRCISAGMSLCTHLGNAVPPSLHRHDNIIQRLLARDELTAVFIPDGIHLPPPVLKNLVRAKPAGRVLFTTDCMSAAGGPPGQYIFGRHTLEVGADGVVREPGKPNFAGSSLTMDRAVENVVRFLGWSPEEAHAACSSHVNEVLGL
ncbi:N-acetylglucosamine-6-phosphate deacetylase [Ruficoccus amylovorans]|uniref:N-acetylglucosamine-6-phosphate deacetylase n=1 Tax=Ruficoccus amylovorans TaxID=1804625 RepID=A0A842HIP7_9BACT|nr:N-acetylglucosamine-6-phosphate deacetylase [Ruficoccus amylovorans]MBC2596020.1 N-acetylglucosamine-6-phosphate deacetylase [Ruficoccus amylovorans]